MKYHNISLSINPKVTGIKDAGPQVVLNEKSYNDKERFRKMDEFFRRSTDNGFPDFAVEFRGDLTPAAKLTDFLAFNPYMAGCIFLISQRGKDHFSKYKVSKHWYYPAVISKKSAVIEENYSLFYMPSLKHDVIDFSKSTFYTGNKYLGKTYHPYQSAEDFLGNFKVGIRAETLVLNERFDKSVHLFDAKIGGLFISEQLWEAISNTSGLEIDQGGPSLQLSS